LAEMDKMRRGILAKYKKVKKDMVLLEEEEKKYDEKLKIYRVLKHHLKDI